jgi:hypothetical protein
VPALASRQKCWVWHILQGVCTAWFCRCGTEMCAASKGSGRCCKAVLCMMSVLYNAKPVLWH